MGFTRTWFEYALFSFWGILFLSAGFLTVTLVLGSLRKRLLAIEPAIEISPVSKKELALPIDQSEFTFFEWILQCVLAGLTVTSFILLLTAELGIFRIRYWILSLIIYDLSLLALLFFSKKSFAFSKCWSAFKFHWSDLLAILCACLTFFILNRPAEYVLTNRDPGEYVSIALRLADSGSLRIKDDDYVHFNTPEKEALFLKTPLKDAPHPEVLPGFYLVDPINGFLLPQFFHLFPLWLALGFKLWRFEGLFLFNVICGALGVLLMIPLGRWLLNSRMAGVAASLLLMVNAGQIWISRSPFSEMLAQVLLIGGLWLLAIGMKRNIRGAFLLAALMFGLCFFVRIDSLLLLAPMTIFAGICALTRRSAAYRDGNGFDLTPTSFFVVLGGCVLYSLLHTSVFAYPYFSNVLSTFRKSPLVLIIAGILIGAAAVLGRAGWRFLKQNHKSDWIARNRTIFKRIGVVFLLGIFAFGLFIRPFLPSSREIVSLPPPHEGTIALSNEINLVRLGWYLTPLGLGLALLGALVVLNDILEKKNEILIPSILVFAVFSGFYLYKSRAFPDNYWVIRRYMEVAIPGCLFLAAASLAWLFTNLKNRLTATGASAFCFLFFLLVWVGEFRAVANLWRQTELTGTFDGLGNLAGILKDADIVILEYSRSQDTFSGPLKSVFHKSVYNLATNAPDRDAFNRLMDQWLSQGKRVFILASDEQTQLESRKYDFILKECFYLRTSLTEQTYERLPRGLEALQYVVKIYEVEVSQQKGRLEQVTFDTDFHFGIGNYGFYSAAAADSTVELPGIAPAGETTLLLSARLDALDDRPSLSVEVYLNDSLAGNCEISSEPKVFHFPIPQKLVNRETENRVRFHSSPPSPAALRISSDQSHLGFILDYLKLGSLAPTEPVSLFFVDLGAASDVHQSILEGFYGRVDGSYRWTAPNATVTIPAPLTLKPEESIRVRAVKSCPDPGFKQYLKITLNGTLLGERELVGTGDQFSVYDFPIGPLSPVSGVAVIGISVVPPWNPHQAGASADRRTLGCAVDWIRLE